jgi:hypothetical protein
MKTKVCSCCGLEKQLTDFYKRTKSKNGYMSRCKVCDRLKTNKYRKINFKVISEKKKIYNASYRKQNKKILKISKAIYRERIKTNNEKNILEIKKCVTSYCCTCGKFKKVSFFVIDKYKKNGYKSQCKECESLKTKENIKNLNKNYIRQKLIRTGFTKEEISKNEDLVEIKRLIIKTLRLCKTSKNSEIV